MGVHMDTLDVSAGAQVFDSETMSPGQYFSIAEFLSRSYVHQIFRHGGKGQMLLDRGDKIFSGNRGTEVGSLMDAAWEAVVAGKDWRSLFVEPPREVLAKDGSRRGQPYKDWKASLPPGAMELSSDDRRRLELMWEAVRSHRRATELLESTTACQRSVFWADRSGHKRKALWDGCNSELVYDLKTTSSDITDIGKSFINFGYAWQAAWYSDSAYEVGYEPFSMPFVVVQTVPPYHCKVVRIPDEFVDQARDQIARTLDLIALRRETGEYLSEEYGEEEELKMPAWAYKELYADADAE